MNCDVCNKQKHALENKKSSIISMPFYSCKSCSEEGLEPRYILLLAYMQGDDKAKDRAISMISKKKYIGEDITLAETL